jgi:hypothetical protein
MDGPQQRLRAAAAACLAAAVISSCGHQPAAVPQAQGPASPPASAQTQPPGGAQAGATLTDPNKQACVGVSSIIAHITADTVGWSPTVSPFDRGIASRLTTETRYLDNQALTADLSVRRAVAATSTAFTAVADAIIAKNRAHLDRAIAQSRVAYGSLKKVCSSHH